MARGGFPGMPGGNMQQMIKQAQKMQQQMEKLTQQLDEKEYKAQSGGGMVEAVISGEGEVTSLQINPQAIDPDDAEMLQDMIIAAVNEALREQRQTREREMGKITGGLGGLF